MRSKSSYNANKRIIRAFQPLKKNFLRNFPLDTRAKNERKKKKKYKDELKEVYH